MASDPVELAAKTRVKAWHPHGDESFEAYRRRQITAQLDAICKDGWRLVRTESVEAVVDGNGEWLTLITEEWTPEDKPLCRICKRSVNPRLKGTVAAGDGYAHDVCVKREEETS